MGAAAGRQPEGLHRPAAEQRHITPVGRPLDQPHPACPEGQTIEQHRDHDCGAEQPGEAVEAQGTACLQQVRPRQEGTAAALPPQPPGAQGGGGGAGPLRGLQAGDLGGVAGAARQAPALAPEPQAHGGHRQPHRPQAEHQSGGRRQGRGSDDRSPTRRRSRAEARCGCQGHRQQPAPADPPADQLTALQGLIHADPAEQQDQQRGHQQGRHEGCQNRGEPGGEARWPGGTRPRRSGSGKRGAAAPGAPPAGWLADRPARRLAHRPCSQGLLRKGRSAWAAGSRLRSIQAGPIGPRAGGATPRLRRGAGLARICCQPVGLRRV